jgi:hypothetical protein
MNELTHARLMRLVSYDPVTGTFTRLVGKRANKQTGSQIRAGYVHIYLAGKTYKAHRLAWMYVYGSWPTDVIDHINHNRSDNRICNLRAVTTLENHHNRRRFTRSITGFIGIAWHKRDKRWQATIETQDKATHLGYFKCLGQALKARLAAEKTYHPSRPR